MTLRACSRMLKSWEWPGDKAMTSQYRHTGTHGNVELATGFETRQVCRSYCREYAIPMYFYVDFS